MNEYLFTELISIQTGRFVVMILLGVGLITLYRILRIYLWGKMESILLKTILELMYFVIAAIFTGCVIDKCCNTQFTAYMAIALILGWPLSYVIIKK